MSKISELFTSKLNVINVGIENFKDDLLIQNADVTHLEWTPPGGGNPELIAALDKLEEPAIMEKIENANKLAVERIINSQPVLIGFEKAIDCVPGMTKTTILHAGPPITWDMMNGPMKGAITGALVFEGLAGDLEQAAELAASGEITFSPCHEHNCVGSMAGVTSASMYM
ncbi:MAG: DUF1116 domain-containing protein, partial [Bacillus sp. (in: Bacteria)]|nr:DUF1116 domain-containing protein [Bacillus sp. (in: firmicutes)]